MPDSNQSPNPTKRAENDETLAKAEAEANQELADNPEGETPAAEPSKPEGEQEAPASEGKTEDNTAQPASEAESDDQAPSQISARGQDRMHDLANKANQVPELEKKITFLENLIKRNRITLPPDWGRDKTQPQNAEPGGSTLPWDKDGKPAEDGGTREVSQEQYEAEVAAKAREAAREEIDNENIANALQTDGLLVEDKYPEFKKPTEGHPNPLFDQELVTFVWGIYENEFKANRKVRLLDIVEKVMSIRRKGAEEGKKANVDIVNKQAAEQAIDPSGTPQPTGDNNSLEGRIKAAKSMKELEALEKSISAE